MRASHYALFRRTLAANMRHAGAIRIDHVMQLQRLFWVPAGFPATEGAYVGYPMDELVAVLAEESRRHRCMVIGEDLGTVAPEVRAAMSICDNHVAPAIKRSERIDMPVMFFIISR